MDSAISSSLGLTKVVLYKHGIGYFERRGKVSGPSKINLLCEADEIDDMLKSLLALTTDGARVDAVTYDSSKTLTSRLSEFGFDITSCSGLAELLGQLKGIPVSVTVSGEVLQGRVLGMDATEVIVNDQIVREMQLTIYMDNSSFKNIALSSISAIKIDDESMAQEVKQQLELLFQNVKKKDRKSLTVSLSEPGEHDLLIAYSIPCPIWKTSYRLVLDAEQRVLLQGMAIVDNVQEEDWTAVQVVLVSASPISFIQPLYDPVQPQRQRIAAQGNVSSGPVVAERAKRKDMPTARLAAPAAAPSPRQRAEPAMEMMAQMEEESDYFGDVVGGTLFNSAGSAAGWGGGAGFTEAFADNISMPIAVEGGEKGELFEYRIQKPVTIPRNSSALLPIVQQVIEGERISLYNESKNTKFPYAAIRFVNNTGLTLEGGPVTVMEGDLYAGEALLDTVKPDDLRFLLYAVDEACPVIVRQTVNSKPVWRARTLNSVIFLDYKQMREKSYEIENLTDRKKTIYIEHPVTPGWNLSSESKPEESTQNYHRFKTEMDAKEAIALKVNEETDAYEQIFLHDYRGADANRLEWLCGQNYVDAGFVKFLKRVLELKAEIKSIEEKMARENELLKQYTNDQARARENLKTLGANNEKYRKLVDTAEDQISQATKNTQALYKELQAAGQAYYEFVAQRLVSDLDSAAANR